MRSLRVTFFQWRHVVLYEPRTTSPSSETDSNDENGVEVDDTLYDEYGWVVHCMMSMGGWYTV